jgi:hypothetical protein
MVVKADATRTVKAHLRRARQCASPEGWRQCGRNSGPECIPWRMRSTYSPCLPTAGKVVPATSNWLHEVKNDGYRLTVVRDGDRVRLFTRNGHDWSSR